MGNVGSWISASDALDRLESRLGGRASAKETLAEMLRDGKLASHAARMWVCDVRDVDIVWEGRHEEAGEWDVDIDVDQSFWRDSVQWSDDVELWRWPESFFLVTQQKRPFERLYLEGVSFDAEAVACILRGDQLLPVPRGKGGRRPDLQRWENFWMEVVQVARDGNLVPGQVASQAALRGDILAAMKGSPLSEDSIKEPVRRIWQRFCEK